MNDVGMVMPVYNQDPHYLILALNSVLQQTYKKFHLVIVIDGANEETRNIIYSYQNDPRITIIEKPVNEGISKALNTGFDYLFTIDEVQYLTWGSSDNILYPDFIKKLRKKLINAPSNVGLVYSCFDHIDEHGNCKYSKSEQDGFREWQRNCKKEDMLDAGFIGTSFMYKKIYAQQTGGYYLEPVEDYEYWLRLSEICDIEFVAEDLMGYRYHSPLSLSRQIHTDDIKHRWWRDQFNSARDKARKRRGIPYETTFLFPVFTLDDKTFEDIENLLEQYYSHYLLIILDCTHQVRNKLINMGINDIRIKVIETSETELNLPYHMNTTTTAITLLYSKGYNLKDKSCLTKLINMLNISNSLGYRKA
ncbi:glycosyltransferase family 2 protein [Bacillus gobiensis]|uniref:glycosyltransferase family 2 protein n=1 Tax=Bacillus gobiensis TaxID=1441095 RepID=UPI003D1D9544